LSGTKPKEFCRRSKRRSAKYRRSRNGGLLARTESRSKSRTSYRLISKELSSNEGRFDPLSKTTI